MKKNLLAPLFMLILTTLACGTRNAPSTVNGMTATPQPNSKTLTGFNPVYGTPYYYAAIIPGDNERSASDIFISSGSGYSYFTYNYVFFDSDTEQFHQLFPQNNQSILSKSEFSCECKELPAGKIRWITYAVVTSDTNADNLLDYRDKMTVAMTDSAGKNYTVLLEGVEQVLSQIIKNESKLLIIYVAADKKYLARIDLNTRSVLQTSELPALGEDVK
jgi:hypothetical protein